MSRRSAGSDHASLSRESGAPGNIVIDPPRVRVLTPGLWVGLAILIAGIVVISRDSTRTIRARSVIERQSGVVKCVALSPDGRRISIFNRQGLLVVREAETGRVVSNVQGRADSEGRAAIAIDGSVLAVANRDLTVSLIDLPSGERRAELPAHAGPAWALAFSRDGSTLASADDARVRLWDASNGRLRFTPQLLMPGATSLAFAPDGRTLAAGGRDGSLRLWDLGTGVQWDVLQAHRGPVTSLAFSDDCKLLGSASAGENSARLWKADQGGLLVKLEGQSSPVQRVVFATGGRTMITAGLDGALCVWDVPTGRLRETLSGHDEAVTGLVFSTDGRTLASVSSESIRLWDAEGLPQPKS